MSRVQPQTLSNEELLTHIYMANYVVPAEVVKALYERYVALLDTAEDDLK
jgi:hypothetical protein